MFFYELEPFCKEGKWKIQDFNQQVSILQSYNFTIRLGSIGLEYGWLIFIFTSPVLELLEITVFILLSSLEAIKNFM